jgi:NifU-like protein involved in Fe-S cluster formation
MTFPFLNGMERLSRSLKGEEEGMSDSDLIKLYSGRILELAASIPNLGRLNAPDGTAKMRSPLCGSTVTVDLRIENGRIAEFAQDVKACALGQASAAILGRKAIGLTESDIVSARDGLRQMLAEGAEPPGAPFEDLSVLAAARDFRNRHASILLAFDATAEAFRNARESACA